MIAAKPDNTVQIKATIKCSCLFCSLLLQDLRFTTLPYHLRYCASILNVQQCGLIKNACCALSLGGQLSHLDPLQWLIIKQAPAACVPRIASPPQLPSPITSLFFLSPLLQCGRLLSSNRIISKQAFHWI